MNDRRMKRRIKWHTEGSYIDTDMYDYKYLIDYEYEGNIVDNPLWPKTNSAISNLKTSKEEKKMEDKKYYSGSVAVKTWRTRWTVKDFNDTMTNRRTDLITFREGRFMGTLLDPKNKVTTRMPIEGPTTKRFTKEDIVEAITNAWDEGKYAEDQTDISWIFNPDPEGFTGTVDLATVLLKDPKGTGGCLDAYYNPQVCARCRVRIVDGIFFEKLEGSSELADIIKNYRYRFSTKKDVEKRIKDKWYIRDFGKGASYYVLDIEEE